MFCPTSSAIVATDRAGRGLQRIGGADHLTRRLHGAASLQDHRDKRARGDECHQLAEERALGVLGVVALGELGGHRHVRQRGDTKALALEASDDLAGQAPREGVGLYEDECSLHGSLVVEVGGQRSVGESISSRPTHVSAVRVVDRLSSVSAAAGGSARRRLRRDGAAPGTSVSQ